MGDDLHEKRLKWVRRELDQVGAAVSLVGTRRPMLLRMARYLEPSIEGLRGTRPEVRKLREALLRAQNNLQRGPTTPLRAGRNLRVARDLMDDVIQLQGKGMLDLPEEYEEGRLALKNVWGYTPDELRVFRGVLRQVVSDLSDAGLYRKLVYGDVVLDPEASGKLTRDPKNDALVADPLRARKKSDFFEVFGLRVWSELFDASDRRTWGTMNRFVEAFARAMGGKSLDQEEKARLRVTVGRIGGEDWPVVAA